MEDDGQTHLCSGPLFSPGIFSRKRREVTIIAAFPLLVMATPQPGYQICGTMTALVITYLVRWHPASTYQSVDQSRPPPTMNQEQHPSQALPIDLLSPSHGQHTHGPHSEAKMNGPTRGPGRTWPKYLRRDGGRGTTTSY